MIDTVKGAKSFIAWLIVGALIAIPIIYYLMQENAHDILTENRWCVEKVTFNKELIGPGTTYENPHAFIGSCVNQAEFLLNSSVILPGFNSEPVTGYWKYEKDQIVLKFETFSNVYSGNYEWEWREPSMELKSSNTIILLKTDNIEIPEFPVFFQ